MEELKFDLEKISSYLKVSKEFISEMEINSSVEDYFYKTLTVRLDAFICSALADERTLIYICPRPKFLDWLFRREKEIKWKILAKDLLLNPPKYPGKTKRIYITEEK